MKETLTGKSSIKLPLALKSECKWKAFKGKSSSLEGFFNKLGRFRDSFNGRFRYSLISFTSWSNIHLFPPRIAEGSLVGTSGKWYEPSWKNWLFESVHSCGRLRKRTVLLLLLSLTREDVSLGGFGHAGTGGEHGCQTPEGTQ